MTKKIKKKLPEPVMKKLEEVMDARGNVLYASDNLCIKENVCLDEKDSLPNNLGKNKVLVSSRNCYIKGNVKTTTYVLGLSFDSHIEGDVIAKGEILDDAVNCYIEGNVTSGGFDTIRPDGVIYKDTRGDILGNATDCFIKGNVDTTHNILYKANNCLIMSDKLKAKGIFEPGLGCIVAAKEIDIESIDKNWLTLITKDTSFIDKTKMYFDVDDGLICEPKKFCKDADVSSEDTCLYVINYLGGWDELTSYMLSEFKKENHGDLSALELLFIEKSEITSLNKFKKELSKVNKKFEKIKDKFRQFKDLCDLHLFEKDILPLSNSERISYFNNFEEQIKNKLNGFVYGDYQGIVPITESVAEKISKMPHVIEFLKYAFGGSTKHPPFWEIETIDDMNINDFIETFTDEGKTRQYILTKGIRNEFFDFESNEIIYDPKTNKETVLRLPVRPEVNQILNLMNNNYYREGLELFKKLMSGNISMFFEIDDDLSKYVKDKIQLTNEIDRQIHLVNMSSKVYKEIHNEVESGGNLSAPDRYTDLEIIIHDNPDMKDLTIALLDKRELNNKISFLKNTRKEAKIKEIVDLFGKNPDIKTLKLALNELSQHYLKGRIRDKAQYISDKLILESEDLETNTLKVSVWNKSLYDLPTYEQYHNCQFIGSLKREETNHLFDSMPNSAVSYLKLDVGNKSAMAMCLATKNEQSKKVLLIDSIESASNIFTRNDVIDTVRREIEKYASVSGFDAVMYTHMPGNYVAKKFYKSLRTMKPEGYELTSGCYLSSFFENFSIDQSMIEFDLKNPQGLMKMLHE